ncbi:glycoside hydrolase family 11 protein [Xylariales sp. PMI_506]|nr:glycoside hydrolase family 11 protein [Xylariales sp. PMI_506]
MISFSSYLVTLAVLGRALAVPVDAPQSSVDERGPHDLFMGPDSFLSRRATIDYDQDYTTGGSVSYSPSSTGFSVTWSNAQDFVVGVGWKTGTSAPISYGGTFSTSSGTGLLSVYGWTTNPLVEYYVVEDSTSFSSGGTQKGTFTSDGATYTVWENTRVNEPSIVGTATFNQYISIRNTPRTSGTVTIANHFTEWASLGMNLGTMNYQVVAVEGWSGSGSASQSVSNSGSTGTGTTTTSTSSPTGTSGTCSALYGQCGGIGWSGPTCCSSGTCKVGNAYYSQCL